MEKVTVIIPTYNRPEILTRAVGLMQKNLIYDGEINILIGDDGDDPGYTSRMSSVISGIVDVRVLTGPRRGLGANLNMLINAANSEIILQMDDDHFLEKPLDINGHVKRLMSTEIPRIEWIRLFLGTEEDLNNDDPFYQFRAALDKRYWVLLPWEGPELYLPSNRPHLKHKTFHRKVGMYQENLKLGETETEFCHRYINYMEDDQLDDPDHAFVAVPVVAPSFDTWAHVGDSWQKQSL